MDSYTDVVPSAAAAAICLTRASFGNGAVLIQKSDYPDAEHFHGTWGSNPALYPTPQPRPQNRPICRDSSTRGRRTGI